MEKADVVDLKAIEGTLRNKDKTTHSKSRITIVIPSTAQLSYCIIHFVPSSFTPGMTDTDFVDTFLAFRKGVFLLITALCIIYIFLHVHALIFYQPV